MAIPILCDGHPGCPISTATSRLDYGFAIPVLKVWIIGFLSETIPLSDQGTRLDQPPKCRAHAFCCTRNLGRELFVAHEGTVSHVVIFTHESKKNAEPEIRYSGIARKVLEPGKLAVG
jgi:hypothetical protein